MKYFNQLKTHSRTILNNVLFWLAVGIAFLLADKVFAETITLGSPKEITNLEHDSISYNIPQDIDVDSNGNVYIVDYAQPFILKYDGSAWSTIGEEDEAIFTSPRHVVLDRDNNIYVVADNGHIYKFSSDGTYEEDFSTEGSFTDVAFDSENNMYVVISETYIAKRSEDNWDTYADSLSGIFTDVSGITFDSEDNLYVVDEEERKVMKYNSDTGWETLPNPGFSLDEPTSIKVDSNGTIFIVDHDEGWIAMYDPDTSTWSNYTVNDSLNTPTGITVFEAEDDFIIYVADGLAENVFKLVYDNPYTSTDTTVNNQEQNTSNKKFSEDRKCHWPKPGETTWIIAEPATINGVSGIKLTWTQYTADKVDIKIDDGTGNFPWKLSKIANDGSEFIPNVGEWQQIKVKPYNHCKEGNDSPSVSKLLYPFGWYNL